MSVHARLIVTDLSPPSSNTFNVSVVSNMLTVHDVVEGRHRSTLCVELSVLGRTRETPFHGALETVACGCVFRHGARWSAKELFLVDEWLMIERFFECRMCELDCQRCSLRYRLTADK